MKKLNKRLIELYELKDQLESGQPTVHNGLYWDGDYSNQYGRDKVWESICNEIHYIWTLLDEEEEKEEEE